MVLTRGGLPLCPQGLSVRQRAETEWQKSVEAIVARLAPSEGPIEMSGSGPEARVKRWCSRSSCWQTEATGQIASRTRDEDAWCSKSTRR